MKKSTLLFLITGLWLFSSNSHARLCYGPGNDYIYSDICSDKNEPSKICETSGYKLNKVSSSFIYCMDKNCLLGDAKTGCQLCASEQMYVSNELCKACPSNAICDGQNIIGCPNGQFMNGLQCAKCHLSCKTCSGEKENNCTSCDSRAYLSGNTCIDCPPNAVCDGSAYFSCNTGYSKSDGNCVADQQEPAKTNTVNSCPSRMKLSADGCCCINK